MPVFSNFSFLSSNGKTNISVMRCDPDTEPLGIVQIAHGIAEHIARYEDFARYLAENGFIVVGNDHLGHGRSINDESELGFFAENGGWALAVEDMHILHELLRDEYPQLPYFLFGHSMGSFLAHTYIISHRTGLDGVVLCGTGQQAKAMVSAGQSLAALEVRRHGASYKSKALNDIAFGGYNKGFAPGRTVCDWLSRDTEVVDRYIDDPLCGYIPSAGMFRDMMEGIQFISSVRNTVRMNPSLPVFFISGDKDPVGENGAGVLRAYKTFLASAMSDVTLKLYHDCRHELLNELNKQQVYKDILTWINSKIPEKT